MERRIAEGVSYAFKKKGIILSIEDVMKMTRIESDCFQIYAINLDETTYLTWINPAEPQKSFVKTSSWRAEDLI